MKKKSTSPSWYRLGLGLPFALALLPTAVHAACNSGDVGGVAYLELPVAPGSTATNVYGQREANEPGLAGIKVKVVDAAGKEQAVTTDATGAWSATAPAFPVRVEFLWDQAWLKSTVSGAGSNTSVQFIDASNCNVTFGAHNPDDYSDTANPFYLTNLQQNGSGVGNTAPSIQNVRYADTGLNADFNAANGTQGTGPVSSSSAAVQQVGSIWGKALQKNTQRLFASAVLQRHIGFAPTGDAGSIYVTDYASGTPGTFMGSFSLQGKTPANGGAALDFGTVCRSAVCAADAGNTGRELDYTLDANPANPNIDLDAFAKVGKMSVGDLDVDQSANTLWLTNLHQKSLVSVDVKDGFAALPGTVNQYLIGSLPGVPACTGGELRPWALSIHQGRGYLGAVCDALTSQNTADMTAHVLSFDLKKPADGFTSEISFPLNYAKDGGNWNPWSDTDKKVGTNWKKYIQPILSDIEFDESNNMYVAFLDRYGLQGGFYNFVPKSGLTDLWADANNREKTQSLGEILKVCHSASGFKLEGTADCPAGNYGTEFFNDQAGDKAADGSSGAMALLKGSQQLLLSLVDPHPEGTTGEPYWSTQGTNTLSTANGAINNWYSNVYSGNEEIGYNGKSHSMGDIELLTAAAPIEVGNRVWKDTDNDGIQDAGEPGIDGVDVVLACGTDTATVKTANGGQFLFSNKTNATFMGAGESCKITVASGQTPLDGLIVTAQNADTATDNNPLTDVRDSDATTTGEIAFTVGGAGENNHALDVGFTEATPPTVCATPLDPMLAVQYLEVNTTSPIISSTLDDAAILGGERDMKLEKLQSNESYSGTFYIGDDGAGKGIIDLTNGTGDFSKATVVWDGNDNDADTLNPNGLGGVDLSSGDAFKMLVNSVDVERFKITLRVYSGAANVSESVFAYDNPQTGTSTNIPVTFSLAPVVGSGADLTKVGSVEMIFEPIDLDVTANGIDMALGSFTAPCPVVPEKTDLSLSKSVKPTSAKRGETVVYTLTVTNESTIDATGVKLTDTLPAGVTYSRDDSSASSYDKTSGVWDVGNLPKGENKVLNITVTVN